MPLGFERGEGLGAVGSLPNVVPGVFQEGGQCMTKGPVVVDDEYPRFLACSWRNAPDSVSEGLANGLRAGCTPQDG